MKMRDGVILSLGAMVTIVCVISGIFISPILPIGFIGLVIWVLLCWFANTTALFLLGMAIPSIYFSSSQPEIQSVLLLAVYGGMVVFAGLHWRLKDRQSIWNRRLVLIVVCWGIYIWLSRNISRINVGTWDIKYLLVSGISLLPFGWMALIGPTLNRMQGQKYLLAGLCAGALGLALGFLLDIQLFSSPQVDFDMPTVTSITVGSLKNSFAILWVIGLILLLYWDSKTFRWLKFVGGALLLISIAYSFSRSSYMALLIVIAMYFWPRMHSRWLQVFVGLGFALFLIPDSVWTRLGMTWTTSAGFDPSSSTRLVLWQAALQAFLAFPLLGIGLDNFTNYLAQNHYLDLLPQGSSALLTYVYAHNYFLSLFALTGIIGGALGILVFWYSYTKCIELDGQGVVLGEVIKLCLIAFLVASLFGDPLFDPIVLCAFLLVLSALLSVDKVAI